MPNDKTENLIARARAGESRAGQELLMQHHAKLRRMIVVYLDPRLSARIDPSDVLQEVLTCAATRLPDYLEHRPIAFYPWLRQIVHNQLHDVHRRHVTAQRRAISREVQLGAQVNDLSAMHLAQRLVSREDSPSQQLNVKELQERVKRALSQISAGDRELLLMRCVEQLTVAEIGDVLGLSQSAVRSRLRRGLLKLGQAMEFDS